MGSIFSSGLRDQNFGKNGAQGSKLRQENRDQWVPDIPCYDPGLAEPGGHLTSVLNENKLQVSKIAQIHTLKKMNTQRQRKKEYPTYLAWK